MKALKLSPITVRRYIREGKIFARRVGRERKWRIPADAIARFIYNLETHRQKASEDCTVMGILEVWEGVPEHK